MVCGFLGSALLSDPVRRRTITPVRVMVTGNALGVARMRAIRTGPGGTRALWFALGVVFAPGKLAYAEITRRLAPALAGRVNAAFNRAALVGAFPSRWGDGVLLGSLRAGPRSTATALYSARGSR